MKPPPTREEVTQWVKDYLSGKTCQEIAAEAGRKASLVNAKLAERGAYLFIRGGSSDE